MGKGLLLVTEARGKSFTGASICPVGNVIVMIMNSVRDSLRGLVDILDFEPIEQREDTMGLVEVIMYYYSVLVDSHFVSPSLNTDQC